MASGPVASGRVVFALFFWVQAWFPSWGAPSTRPRPLHAVSHDDDNVEIVSDRWFSYDDLEGPHLDPSVGTIGILGRGRARSMS